MTTLTLTLALACGVAGCGDDARDARDAHAGDSGAAHDDAGMHDAGPVHDGGGPIRDAGHHPHPAADSGSDAAPVADDDAADPMDATMDARVDVPCVPDPYDPLYDETGDAGAIDVAHAYPDKLSEAGLFSDLKTGTLAPGVRAYEPTYKLWSDGAEKERWVRFPPCTQIDTSDMDFWTYPVGTTAWKQFAFNGQRIETRMMRKTIAGWVMVAYQWLPDQTEAFAVPDGVAHHDSLEHDIPSQNECKECHEGEPDRLLGITALQLSHDNGGLTLADLIAEGTLTAPPALPLQLPGDAKTRAALGYLHANCGHCHNPHGEPFLKAHVTMELFERVSQLGSVPMLNGYATTVGVNSPGYGTIRVIAGDSLNSLVTKRMRTRTPTDLPSQMPPIATKLVDMDGVTAVSAWIDALPH